MSANLERLARKLYEDDLADVSGVWWDNASARCRAFYRHLAAGPHPDLLAAEQRARARRIGVLLIELGHEWLRLAEEPAVASTPPGAHASDPCAASGRVDGAASLQPAPPPPFTARGSRLSPPAGGLVAPEPETVP